MNFPDVKPIVVASHPRSGTHLLIDLLRHQFKECRSWKWPGERLDRLYCSIDELNASRGRLDEAAAHRILSRTSRPLIKTHAWPNLQDTFLTLHHDGIESEWVQWLQRQATWLYVYRDGRDVMCSYLMMWAGMDEGIEESVGGFMRGHDPGQKTNRARRWAQHVRRWDDTARSRSISFEVILGSPDNTIERLGRILNLSPEWRSPVLPEKFSSIWESRWARAFQLRPESTAILGTGSEDWRDAFTREDRVFFHREAGDTLEDFGYVTSDAWVNNGK